MWQCTPKRVCVCAVSFCSDTLRVNRNNINPPFCSPCSCVFVIFNNTVSIQQLIQLTRIQIINEHAFSLFWGEAVSTVTMSSERAPWVFDSKYADGDNRAPQQGPRSLLRLASGAAGTRSEREPVMVRYGSVLIMPVAVKEANSLWYTNKNNIAHSFFWLVTLGTVGKTCW